jgi:hypothetical protein
MRAAALAQGEAMISAHLSVAVGAISAFIATGTLHFSLYQRAEASKKAQPYLLLVGRRFSSDDSLSHMSPEFGWEEIPASTAELKVVYGLLNQGGDVIINSVTQRIGLLRVEGLRWATQRMSESTGWRSMGSGRGYRQVPYPTRDAVPSTPILGTWLTVRAMFGKPIIMKWTNPETKDAGTMRIHPERLPIASLNYHKQNRHAD